MFLHRRNGSWDTKSHLRLFVVVLALLGIRNTAALSVKVHHLRHRTLTTAAAAATLAAAIRPNEDDSNTTLLILGLGRVGQEVARLAQPHFTSIVGTVRSDSTQQQQQEQQQELPIVGGATASATIISTAVPTIPFDIQHIQPQLAHVSHVLITIPPQNNPNDQEELDDVYDALIKSLARRRRRRGCCCCCWIGIISTAGVYGDHQGAWVTEEETCDDDATTTTWLRPTDDTAKRYVAYEEQWKRRISELLLSSCSETTTDNDDDDDDDVRDGPTTACLRIFRCAGIYGPQQSALHTAWRQRLDEVVTTSTDTTTTTVSSTLTTTSTISTSSSTSTTTATSLLDPPTPTDLINRIHITDLARAVVSSILLWKHNALLPSAPPQHDVVRIYNLADDLPESRRVVLEYAANLLQKFKGLMPVLSSNNPREDRRRQVGDVSKGSTAIGNLPQPLSPSLSPLVQATSPIPSTRSRRRLDCKRVSNQRMKQELLVDGLLYPTYREGLDCILQDPTTPWQEGISSDTAK